ncbi:unnamed protein product [Diamesa serratosioi]
MSNCPTYMVQFSNQWMLLIVMAVSVSTANSGMFTEVVESAAYTLLRQSILEAGKSEQYANCIEKVLKFQGAGKDIKENIFNPDRLLQHLKNELNTADLLCENRIVFSLVAIVLAILIIISICSCCRRR